MYIDCLGFFSSVGYIYNALYIYILYTYTHAPSSWNQASPNTEWAKSRFCLLHPPYGATTQFITPTTFAYIKWTHSCFCFYFFFIVFFSVSVTACCCISTFRLLYLHVYKPFNSIFLIFLAFFFYLLFSYIYIYLSYCRISTTVTSSNRLRKLSMGDTRFWLRGSIVLPKLKGSAKRFASFPFCRKQPRRQKKGLASCSHKDTTISRSTTNKPSLYYQLGHPNYKKNPQPI